MGSRRVIHHALLSSASAGAYTTRQACWERSLKDAQFRTTPGLGEGLCLMTVTPAANCSIRESGQYRVQLLNKFNQNFEVRFISPGIVVYNSPKMRGRKVWACPITVQHWAPRVDMSPSPSIMEMIFVTTPV